jgi:lipopolysaccharide transport system ATP-binding protein
MSDVALRVQGLSKQYLIGAAQSTHDNFREMLTGKLAALLPRRSRAARVEREIWALRDVSFEVKRGEIVGIIGRNGAGKSTLLKILSRITDPTSGRAELYGRIGSLLEVGTGFHPELSGRENIYLNGAILGMSRKEIEAKFDQIVAFSEISRFIDTPVKRYSSGMYVRLAFAVAAHLQPEILVVDEVLAVGDIAFQRKCLNKLEDVGRDGRTILFVSHNISAITRLCSRAILLEGGQIVQDGPARAVVGRYMQAEGTRASREWPDRQGAPGDGVARVVAVRIRTETGEVAEAIDIRRPVGIETEYEVLTPGHVLGASTSLYNEEGTCVFVAGDQDPAWRRRPRPIGRFVSTAWIPGNFLAEGMLTVRAAVITEAPLVVHFDVHQAVAFNVVDSQEGDSARGDYMGVMVGVVRPILTWTTQFLPANGHAASASRPEQIRDVRLARPEPRRPGPEPASPPPDEAGRRAY